MKWCISSISQKLQFSGKDIRYPPFKVLKWSHLKLEVSTLTVHIFKNTSSCHKGLTSCLWKEDFRNNNSHYSQHTRGPSHLNTEVGWELSQVSLLRNLTVLGVADVDRGHGVLGDKKLEVTWKTEFQKEIFCLLRHLTRWIWIISRCAEVTVDGITT